MKGYLVSLWYVNVLKYHWEIALCLKNTMQHTVFDYSRTYNDKVMHE